MIERGSGDYCCVSLAYLRPLLDNGYLACSSVQLLPLVTIKRFYREGGELYSLYLSEVCQGMGAQMARGLQLPLAKADHYVTDVTSPQPLTCSHSNQFHLMTPRQREGSRCAAPTLYLL